MKVRPARGQSRQTAQKPPMQKAYSWPAPTRGLVANGNLAVSQPGTAVLMENFWPTATGIITRRGSETHNTLAAGPVRALFSYTSGTIGKMFAANDAQITDVTIAGSPTDQLACTNGDWITAQYQSSDGTTYLRGVNGSDTPFVYDGSSFSTTPALTFPGGSSVVPQSLNFTWVYKNRFFFIQKESLDAWYLPVGQIGGELARFSLGGLFKLGGSLVMGATWSRDTGSGMNAMCAFFSSEGEVAIYQGDNPGDSATWGLVGVFRAGKPRGRRSIMDAGGDLLTATDVGMVPLSTALEKDFAILGNEALSEGIVDLWNEEVANRASNDWNVTFWSTRQMVVVSLPTVSDRRVLWLACNARTRAWTTFTGWDATCVHVFNDRLFFGDASGNVVEANVSGMDNGQPFTATCIPSFDQMDAPGWKTVHQLRAVMRGPNPVDVSATVQSEYDINIPAAPSASAVPGVSVWGDAEWGLDVWASSETTKYIYQDWVSAFGAGEVHAPCIQTTSGSIGPLDAELIRVDAVFTQGQIVV